MPFFKVHLLSKQSVPSFALAQSRLYPDPLPKLFPESDLVHHAHESVQGGDFFGLPVARLIGDRAKGSKTWPSGSTRQAQIRDDVEVADRQVPANQRVLPRIADD